MRLTTINGSLCPLNIQGRLLEMSAQCKVVFTFCFRNVKKDVYELVKGPTGEDNFYILAALSDMKAIFEATVKDLKKSSKSNKNIEVIKADDEEELPAWLSEKQQKPELEHTRVRKHLKKIEFYLSWTQDFYEVFKEL